MIVLAGRNLAKMEAAKAELDELGVESCLCKTDIADRAQKHCRILSISPGCYLTPMHQKLIDNQPETAENQLELIPAGRWGHPYEMGALTAFLCSPGAGYINGVDILADGCQNAGIFVPQI